MGATCTNLQYHIAFSMHEEPQFSVHQSVLATRKKTKTFSFFLHASERAERFVTKPGDRCGLAAIELGEDAFGAAV